MIGMGVTPAIGTIYRLDVNKAIGDCAHFPAPSMQKDFLKIAQTGAVTPDWTGVIGLIEYTDPKGIKLLPDGTYVSLCSKALTVLDRMQGVERVQYSHVALFWWGGNFQLKQKRLEVAVPCSPLKAALLPLTKRWCVDKETCQTHFPGGLMLDEGGHARQPWDLFVFKKSFPGEGSWSKTVACTKPTQPTTRTSGLNCCTWKELSGNKTGQIALL